MISARTILGPLGLTLASIVVAIIGVAMMAPPLVAAIVTDSPDIEDDDARIEDLVDAHSEEIARYRDRFEGRSPFFPPPAPAPPPRETSAADTRARPEPQNVGPAPTYDGPLREPSILGDKVRFASINDWVAVGETRQGVEVVRIEPPYTVVVRWTRPSTPTEIYEEGEYELSVFERAFSEANSPFRTSAPESDRRHPGLKVVPEAGPAGAAASQARLQAADDHTFDDEDENDDEEN